MRRILFAALVGVSSAGAARGTTELAYLVSQPVESDEGVTVGVNTYLGYGGAGLELLLTAAENCVSTQNGGFRDINAASRLGIKVRMLPEDERQSGQLGYLCLLHGDTLRVVLDATSVAAPRVDVSNSWKRAVVETTLRCMTENAAREPSARYLDVRVEGAAEYRNLAGQQPISLRPEDSPN